MLYFYFATSLGGSEVKASACNVGDLGLIPGWEDPLEKAMATHSSILAWRIPWLEEPGVLQSTGSQRVRHDRATSLHFYFAKVQKIPQVGNWGKCVALLMYFTSLTDQSTMWYVAQCLQSFALYILSRVMIFYGMRVNMTLFTPLWRKWNST